MAALLSDEIAYATLVRAEPEAVYDCLTTAAGLDAWFTQGAVVELHPGGRILFRWRDWGVDQVSFEEEGRVIETRRPVRFVFQWHPDRPDYATTVEVDFERVESGTVVRLREHGYQDTPSGRQKLIECACGWGEALTLLKFYVEHGVRY